MKERPILFSAPMVRALLDGSKTQTRRIVKLPSKHSWGTGYNGQIIFADGSTFGGELSVDELRCPYGQPGDRLWVRETWWHPEPYSYGTLPSGEEMQCPRYVSKYAPIVYASDGNPPNIPNRHYAEGLRGGAFSAPDPYAIWTKRPSIFMPRWASRILLEITAARVERLQDISEEDAKAEGVESYGDCYCVPYRRLWETINGSGSWAENPFVWVISFKPVER